MFPPYRKWQLLFLAVLLLASGIFLSNCSILKLHHDGIMSNLRKSWIKEYKAQLSMGEMNYLSGGNGFPIVFVHGFGAGAPQTWKDQLAVFAKTHRVLAPDLFWFGDSKPKPGQSIHTPDAQAKAIAELLDQHGLTRVHIAGVSFGGYISLKFALNYPTRVASLTLVDAAGLRLTKAEENQVKKTFPYSHGDVRKLLLPNNTKTLKKFLGKMLYKPPYMPEFALKEILEREFRKNKEAKTKIAYYLQHNFISLKQLKTIKVPTQVVWGKHDQLLPSSLGQRLAKSIPHAKFTIIPKSGHIPMLEQPKEFNKIFGQFLQQLAQGALPKRGTNL